MARKRSATKSTALTAQDTISVRGCRVHNLKSIDLDLPRGKMIALCGLSGSGKTSLALDTLYAEGQRAYIESFTAYTRQFLARLDKPDCDSITGIPPAIAVTRQGGSKTNRSTVGTATEIADHLRLLYAKAATLSCYRCGRLVRADDPSEVAAQLQGRGSRHMIGFPIWLPDRTAGGEILLGLQQDGYQRLILGQRTYHLTDSDRKTLAGAIKREGVEATVIVDRVSASTDLARLTESLETAMGEGHGRATILSLSPSGLTEDNRIGGNRTELDENDSKDAEVNQGDRLVSIDDQTWQQQIISEQRRCDACDLDYPDAVPRLFNFNHPLGACFQCEGFGELIDFDMDLIVPNKDKTLAEGAIEPWNTPSYSHEREELLELADDYDIPVDIPYRKLKKKHLQLIHEGVPARQFGGLSGFFKWLDRKKYKMHVRVFASRYRSYRTCDVCDGKRYKPSVLAYRLQGKTIADLFAMTADQAASFLDRTEIESREQQIAAEPLRQIRDRLGYLQSVGLGYLQLERPLRTLSGGETQRVALTAALGGSLVNMLYVLDEPTAGLHPSDVTPLIDCVHGLRDRGNTVIVVEHNEQMIRAADQVVEIGPGAGVGGGEVVFQGTPKQIAKSKTSLTGMYLRRDRGQTLRSHSARESTAELVLKGASGHNLQSVDVAFPLGVLCVVSGVSGSGKSSLVVDTLLPAIQTRKKQTTLPCLPYQSLTGVGQIQQCIAVDQSPISRSPRSCPATFLKVFDPIRKVFAATGEAQRRGLTASHFTFNNAKGQCPECEGAGVLQVDMHFLADVQMRCPECRGTRYRGDILKATYRDRSIADVLNMSAAEAFDFFRGAEKVQTKLQRMLDVGLGYLSLGQSASTLSSGEGQRLKLAEFLASSSRKRTLFVMDEPTTGLHDDDLVRLVDCMDALIHDGHSLIVIEHNPLLMLSADHIIDLGPGGGDKGGSIVATGTPQQLISHSQDVSLTAKALAEHC